MHGKDLLAIRGGKHGKNIAAGNARCDRDTVLATEGTGRIRVGHSYLEGCRILAEDGAEVQIGDDCSLKGLVIVCRADSKVKIGNFVKVHGDFWGEDRDPQQGRKICSHWRRLPVIR